MHFRHTNQIESICVEKHYHSTHKPIQIHSLRVARVKKATVRPLSALRRRLGRRAAADLYSPDVDVVVRPLVCRDGRAEVLRSSRARCALRSPAPGPAGPWSCEAASLAAQERLLRLEHRRQRLEAPVRHGTSDPVVSDERLEHVARALPQHQRLRGATRITWSSRHSRAPFTYQLCIRRATANSNTYAPGAPSISSPSALLSLVLVVAALLLRPHAHGVALLLFLSKGRGISVRVSITFGHRHHSSSLHMVFGGLGFGFGSVPQTLLPYITFFWS